MSFAPPAKRPRTSEDLTSLLDTSTTPLDSEITSATVKRWTNALEKAVTKNTEMRIKYKDVPSKWMESETDVHQAIRVGVNACCFGSEAVMWSEGVETDILIRL